MSTSVSYTVAYFLKRSCFKVLRGEWSLSIYILNKQPLHITAEAGYLRKRQVVRCGTSFRRGGTGKAWLWFSHMQIPDRDHGRKTSQKLINFSVIKWEIFTSLFRLRCVVVGDNSFTTSIIFERKDFELRKMLPLPNSHRLTWLTIWLHPELSFVLVPLFLFQFRKIKINTME